MNGSELLQLLEQAWSAVDELCASLTAEDWGKPTDCPGWTVKDQLAHMAAIESILLGRPPATGEAPRAPHVKNPLGERNEIEVEARRPLAPEGILEEFRDVTAERLKRLSSLGEEGWDREVTGPFGQMKLRDALPIRILDTFYHEQDIRVATGRPGHLSGAVAKLAFDRLAGAMGMVVGKRVAPPDGTTVVFAVGAPGRTFALRVEGGRANPADPPPDAPTARLTMDLETFLRLVGGRWSAEEVQTSGRVRIEGDAALGERVLADMAVIP